MADSERYQKGAAKMKELFGAEPRPGSMHEDFLDITVKNLFGDIWGRDGLAIQERSMITLAALTVLGRDPELKVHIRGALNIGISRDKINESHDPSGPLRRLAGRRQRPAARQTGVRQHRREESQERVTGIGKGLLSPLPASLPNIHLLGCRLIHI